MPHPLVTVAERLVEVISTVDVGEPFEVDWDFWRVHDDERGELDELKVMVFAKLRTGVKVGQTGWQHQLELSVSFEKKLAGNDDQQDKLPMQQAHRNAAVALLEKSEAILDAIKTAEYGDVLLREPKAPGVGEVLPDCYQTGIFLRVVGLTFDEQAVLLPDED